MENIRRRIDVKLVRSTEGENLRKLIAKPFNRSVTFDDNLAGIHMNKSKLRLDQPTYVGMSILDLSKNLMYDWHYNHLKNTYGNRVQMLYTDTDSLILHIRNDDVYTDMAQHAGQYDIVLRRERAGLSPEGSMYCMSP